MCSLAGGVRELDRIDISKTDNNSLLKTFTSFIPDIGPKMPKILYQMVEIPFYHNSCSFHVHILSDQEHPLSYLN